MIDGRAENGKKRKTAVSGNQRERQQNIIINE